MTTATPTPATPRRQRSLLARAGVALGQGATSLRTGFNRVANRTTLSRAARLVIAPLLMTTALSGDVVTQTPPDATVWSHGAYSNAFAQGGRLPLPRHLSTDTEGTTALPLRCYTPQRDERHPLLTLNPTAWRGFYQLSRAGEYSRALHTRARELGLSVCETTESTLVRNYDGDHRITGISTDATLATTIREAAHGITHALMQHNALSAPAVDEALFSRLNRHLTAEAIALTAEYVVAAELAAAGESAVMRSLDEENHPALAVFKDTLRANADAGTDSTTAITAAAGKTISYLLREPAFIAANSDIVLRNYLGELVMPGARPLAEKDFGDDDMHKMASASRHALTRHTALLTGEDLAKASPETAAIVDALQRMHAEKNRYRAPRRIANENTYRGITREAVQEHINISGGIYTVTQAFDRAANAGKNIYPEREWQLGETFRHGLQADYTRAQTPAVAQPLWDHLDRLNRQSPSIGPAMVDYARRKDIVMCYGHLGPNLLGQWQPDSGLVVMAHAQRDNIAGSVRILAHELLHQIQKAHGISSFYTDSSIADIQMSRLSQEAAASTISIIIALEFKTNGDDSLWHFGTEQGFADRMLQVYNEARDAGTAHKPALEAAGLEGFQLMYNRQWWQDTYNNGIAMMMLERIHNGWFKAPGTRRYPLDSVRRAGDVSADFNFTRDLNAPPTDQMRFGANDDMRHLFDYLHLHQLQKNRGANHESVVAHRQLMTEKNNPYIDIDLSELVAHYHADTRRPLTETLNCMTGRGDCPAGLPTPVHHPAPAPRVPSCAGN